MTKRMMKEIEELRKGYIKGLQKSILVHVQSDEDVDHPLCFEITHVICQDVIKCVMRLELSDDDIYHLYDEDIRKVIENIRDDFKECVFLYIYKLLKYIEKDLNKLDEGICYKMNSHIATLQCIIKEDLYEL